MEYLNRKFISSHFISDSLFNGSLLVHFNKMELVEQAGIHTHNTRQIQRYRINITKTQRAQNTIRNFLPKFANSLPECIYDKLSTHSFQIGHVYMLLFLL